MKDEHIKSGGKNPTPQQQNHRNQNTLLIDNSTPVVSIPK